MHITRLSNAMRTVLRLRVHRRVPVRVVKNHRVGTDKIDSQTTAPRGQYERKHLFIAIETVHHTLALFYVGRPVEAKVRVPVQAQKTLENVEHFRHLRENKTAVPACLQLRQQSGKCLKLAAVVLNKPLVRKENTVAHVKLIAAALDDVLMVRARQRT